MTELIERFYRVAEAAPERVAIIAPGETLSFGGLRDRAEGFAAQLAGAGVGPGDRVLAAMGVRPALYSAILGAWRVGATVVFPEPSLGLRGLFHAVRVAEPRGMITQGWWRALGLLPPLWPLRAFDPGRAVEGRAPERAFGEDDRALISFTTGSTGAPKAIARSHGFLAAQAGALEPLLHSEAEERDLVGFPAFVLLNLAGGRCSVLPGQAVAGKKADAAGLKGWAEKAGATRALLPPSACAGLLEAGLPEALHTVFTGGGPVFPDLLHGLEAAGRRAVAVYGSTEAEPIAVLDAAEIDERDWADMAAGRGILAGKPVPAARLEIVDDEITVTGAHVNKTYLDPTQDAGTKVARAGETWHRTGDAGALDGEGRLWLLGRWKDRVEAVDGALYPFQAELQARRWPGVRAAALLGEGIDTLFIAGEAAREAEYRAAARDALGVTRVRMVEAIPMDRRHGSKVDRAALRKL